MRKYLSFLRLKFFMGLQYRAAALAGFVTQFAWGGLKILMFAAFYRENPAAFPMKFEALSSYIWLEQATLALFMIWGMEYDIFECITNGNVAYELCRPISIYNMWFARGIGYRYAKMVLRCVPVLVLAILLPKPYGLILPSHIEVWFLFVISMILASLVTISLCMLIYITCFFTISSMGIRIITASAFEFLQGGVIPIPFFPPAIARVMELLPFAAMQNVPLRIWSGDISGMKVIESMGLQVFWFVMLALIGKLLCARAMRKICVQGG